MQPTTSCAALALALLALSSCNFNSAADDDGQAVKAVAGRTQGDGADAMASHDPAPGAAFSSGTVPTSTPTNPTSPLMSK